MPSYRPSVLLLVCTIVAAVNLFGQTPPATIPADVFFKPIDFTDPKLSPSGRAICALSRFDDRHYELVLTALETMTTRSLAKAADMTVEAFWWKSDDLMLLLVENDAGVRDFRSLDIRTGAFNLLPQLKNYFVLTLINELPGDPEKMLFKCSAPGYLDRRSLIAVNLRTGEDTALETDGIGVDMWMVNRSGEAVSGWGSLEQQHFLLWRRNRTSNWNKRVLATGTWPELVPLGLAPDQSRSIVIDYSRSPTGRVCYYDPVKEQLEEIIGSRAVEPKRIISWGRHQEIAGIIYETEREECVFFNAEAETAHQWLEKALPGTIREYVSFSSDGRRAILVASQNKNPGVYFLLDFATKNLKALSLVQRSLNPSLMASSRSFRFITSDHEVITGRVTLPDRAERPPLIVAVGPSLDQRHYAETFDPLAQFFASRGYAVARVNHRGTSGLGRDFSAKGDFQYCTGMAQDIAESVAWLSEQKWVDAKRVAVLGQGWGGIIAFACAGRSGPFRALINFESPIDVGYKQFSEFSVSERSDKELFEAAGGKAAALAYGKLVSPIRTVQQVSVPSFHFYAPTRSGVGNGATDGDIKKLQAALKNQKLVYEFPAKMTDDEYKKTELADWKIRQLRAEGAVQFLDRHLVRDAPDNESTVPVGPRSRTQVHP